MDAIDVEILATLVAHGRATFAELSDRVGLSGPSTADRVRKLEESGVVTGYCARLDPVSIGLDLAAFIEVTLAGPEFRDGFLIGVESLPNVLECHHVAGEADYLVKVRVAGTAGLESAVSDGIKALPGVARTRTTVVLSSPVERPLGPEAGAW